MSVSSDDLLQELAEILTQKLMEEGLDGHKAMAMAALTVDEIQSRWRGMDVYFPSPDRQYQMEFRDADIRENYDGTNALELCRKYEISHRRLRQIIATDSRPTRVVIHEPG